MAETALITGASAGIGEEFARQLAARGYDLILVARRKDRLEKLAEQLPTTAHVIECDLGSEAAKLPAKVAKLGVDVNLLVNNAGFGLRGRILELDPEREAEMVRVNCEAVVVLTHAFIPSMVERGRGGVITVASTAGMQPLPYETTYGASKAFAISFMEALSMELKDTGVKCLVVNPGPVKTEWQSVAGYDENTRLMPGMISAEQCAADALRAYDRGKRSMIPGRLFPWVMRGTVAPKPIKLRVTERIYRPNDVREQHRRVRRNVERYGLRPPLLDGAAWWPLSSGPQMHVRVVLERLGDRTVRLCGHPRIRRGGLGQRPRQRVDHEPVRLLAEREASPLAARAHHAAGRAGEGRQVIRLAAARAARQLG